MKKRFVLGIIVLTIIVLIIINLVFHFFYFSQFQKNLRDLNETEKQEVTDILNENLNLSGYEIHIGKIYLPHNGYVPVEVTQGSITKHYLVDVENRKIAG